jgi:hypothetical protein
MTALMQWDPPATPTANGGRPTGGRDPAHAFYRRSAALLASAQALEAASQDSGAVAATAPTLACVETSLAALATTVSRLRGHVLERLSEPVLPADDLRPQRADIAVQFERLAGVLDQASFACGRARASIEPVEDELRAI